MGYIGMCGAKEYGFSAALVINRVSIFSLYFFFFKKKLLLHHCVYGNCVRAATACHALRSRDRRHYPDTIRS